MIKEKNTSIEEERKKLTAKSIDYKEALQDQFGDMKVKVEQWSRTGLVIGGALLIGYILIKALLQEEDIPSKNKSLPVVHDQSGGSRIFNSIMEQIALFLLALAKEKLAELVKEK